MATIYRIMGLALVCCTLYGCNPHAENEAPLADTLIEADKTQIVIIGTIHAAHHKNPKYSPEILKQIVLSLKPTAILIELPLSLVEPNGRPIEKIRGKDSDCPEGWAADEAAIKLGIKQIPFDRRDREKFRRKTDYYERKKRSGQQRDDWLERIKKENPDAIELKISALQDYAGHAQDYLRVNAGPELINSDGFDSIVRIKDSVWEDILPLFREKDPQCTSAVADWLFLITEWHERNQIMADNIIKVAKKFPGKRLVVLTGVTHRYILQDLLKDEESIELKEFWEIDTTKIDNSQSSEYK